MSGVLGESGGNRLLQKRIEREIGESTTAEEKKLKKLTTTEEKQAGGRGKLRCSAAAATKLSPLCLLPLLPSLPPPSPSPSRESCRPRPSSPPSRTPPLLLPPVSPLCSARHLKPFCSACCATLLLALFAAVSYVLCWLHFLLCSYLPSSYFPFGSVVN